MKKSITLTFLSLIILFTVSCDKKITEIPLNFQYTGQGATWDIPVMTDSNFTDTVTVYFNADSLAAANKYNIENFKSCSIVQAVFELLDFNSTPYTFGSLIDSLDVFIITPSGNKKLVYLYNIPATEGLTLSTLSTGENIRDYVLEKRYKIFIKAKSKQLITHEFKIKAKLFTYQISSTIVD